VSDRRFGLFTGNRGPIGMLGVFAAASALALTADQYGIVGGALLVLAVVLPVPSAVALGHVLFVALNPDGLAPVAVVAVEAGLLTALVNAGPTQARDVFTALVGISIVVGVVWASLRWGASPWSGVGVLAFLVALGSYGLHRYELVRFDLVEADQ
jgi:hypothetical protein